MNKVDLRRTRRRGTACAAVAAFALLGSYQASAEVANPNLVPIDSAYIVSVPSASAFWAAWEANSLYGAYKEVMAKPEVEAKTANFRKELSIVETSLGFKLDGATLSKVFSTANIYFKPSDSPDESNVIGIFKVSDQEKLKSLLDLAEKAAAQSAAADEETTGAVSADDNLTSPIVEADYQGVKIKTFKAGEDGVNIVYAHAGEFFVVGSTNDEIRQAIDRVKATATSGTVTQSEEFKKIDAALTAEKGELYIYGNQELASSMQSSDGLPASLTSPLKAMMDDLAPLTYYGASVKIAPKEISSYSYGLLKEGSSNSLLLKNPGDKPLKVMSYIPETTMLAMGTSLFDASGVYNLATGAAKTAGSNLDDKLQGAELGMGFSVKNDLVPALGNEVSFALNDVKIEGLLPKVDATIILGVKDKAKMQKVVGGVERLATNAMAAKSDDGGTSATGFKEEDADGQTIKYMEMSGIPGLAPSFVLTDEYLFIGTSKESLKNALKANTDGKNLANSEVLKSLGHGISASANVLQFANMSRMWDVAQQVTSAIPAAQSFGMYIKALEVIQTAASASRVENGAAVGHGVIKLK